MNQRYEQKRFKLTIVDTTKEDDTKGKCVSFFCPETPDYETFPKDWVKGYKQGCPSEKVSGKVKQTSEINYDKVVDLNIVLGKIQDKLFTKKESRLNNGKKVRNTLRKDCEKLPPWEVYMLSSLCQYSRQAKLEGCNKLILSWQECKFLNI